MLHTAAEPHARRSPWAARIVTLAVLLGAFALRLVALDRQDIWWDEARNIDVSLRPFLSIATAPELDIHPPVYFWSLHFWARGIGLSRDLPPETLAFGTRLFSAAAGVCGVALLYALGRRVAGRPAAGAIAALLGAVSPFWLAESQETRMYTLAFLWLTAAALCLLVVVRTDSKRVLSRPFVALVLFSALALLTHYNAAFILVSWYLWWGATALIGPEPLRRIRAILLAGAATIVLAAPVAPIALRQIPGYANPNLIVPTVAEYLSQNWRAYIGGYAFDPSFLRGYGAQWLWAVAFVLVTGPLLVALRWRRRAVRESAATVYPLSFLLFWLAGGLALYYMAVLDRGTFNVRYASFVTPALYVLLAVAVWAWRRVFWLAGALALVVVLAGIAPAVRADLYDARFDREDIRGLTEWLRNNAGPDDVIFVDQKYPFGFYYARYAIDGNPIPEGSEPAPARYLFVDINTIDARLNEWAADARHVFWVQWFESDTDPRRAVAFLLDKEGQRAGEQSFQGYSVDWWTLEPPNRFDLTSGLTPMVVRFPPAVETVEVALPQEAQRAGGKVPVVIRWRRTPGSAVTRPLKARVALYDAEGGRLAQSDPRLLNDRHLLPAEWSAQDTPLNVYMLETPQDLVAGEYELRLLVYDADTLEPLEIVDEAGNPAGIEASLGHVTIQAQSE